jgi:hypothetical protein
MTNGKISFQYPKMVAPFPVKPFDQMTKKEAKQYFDWYVGQMDVRIGLLKGIYKDSGGEGELDETPESLTPLWNWFTKRVRARPMTERDFDYEREQARLVAAAARSKGAQVSEAQIKVAEQFFVEQAKHSGVRLSEETEALCVDVAFYLVKALMNNYPTVHWRIGTGKRYVYYNQPILRLHPDRNYECKLSDSIAIAAMGLLEGRKEADCFLQDYRALEKRMAN